jgi:hypothetical protein
VRTGKKRCATTIIPKLDKNYLNNYNEKRQRQVPRVSPLSFLGIYACD